MATARLMAFEESEVLARFDRSYADKKAEMRLERGEYKGIPTFTLRLYWQLPDGSWRWSAQTPTQSGKCWERFNLKGKELAALGQALIDASSGLGTKKRSLPAPFHEPAPAFSEPMLDDDIPF